jgi:hypothetical protein
MKTTYFYLASTESELLRDVRACTDVRVLKNTSGPHDYLLVHIDPSLIGQPYGFGGEDFAHLVLAARHAETPLMPVMAWPTAVYVCKLLIPQQEALSSGIDSHALKVLGWGEIYDTAEAANAAIAMT